MNFPSGVGRCGLTPAVELDVAWDYLDPALPKFDKMPLT
jgi:hypothetical protein